MKCILLVTKSETVRTFRKSLIRHLLQSGDQVTVVAYDEEYRHETETMGAGFYCVRQENRWLNPFTMLWYAWQVKCILKKEKPDLVMTFQLKPNTFGVLAAAAAGVQQICATVEGVGDVFINQSFKWKLVRIVACHLYRIAFRLVKKVFFLNGDDKAEFEKRGLVSPQQSVLIKGIGVDLEHFAYKPIKKHNTFLMVARMLKTKGVLEYCRCARLVKEKYPDAQFNYLGAEGTVTLADIQEYIDDGSVNYLGTTKDVRPYLESCTALVLPSCREGMPMSVMEAEAVGRAIITTDSVGCRDTVVESYNGFISPCGDYETLAQKCICLLEDRELAVAMGAASRAFAEKNFNAVSINHYIEREIHTMKKAVLLANDTTYVYNLRRELIVELRAKGYEVVVASEVLQHQERLAADGCRLVDMSAGRHGTNPLADLVLFFKYLGILQREKPDVVFTYNIKPSVYGGLACRLLGIRYMPNITGLGTAVENPGKLQKLTTWLYKLGVAGAECVFFQNTENEQFFRNRNMLAKKTRTCLLPGSGVNLQGHPVMQYPPEGQIRFLFAARIMREKGIDLFLAAARKFHSETVAFDVCGMCDDHHYQQILEQAQSEGVLTYHGMQKDMNPFYEKCSCFLYPSYYPEGMSNVLLEAAACGRPAIAADRSGCRETVDSGVTGYIVPVNDEQAVLDAVEKFLSLSWEQRRDMGLAAREKVEKEFDRALVVKAYMEELDKG